MVWFLGAVADFILRWGFDGLRLRSTNESRQITLGISPSHYDEELFTPRDYIDLLNTTAVDPR